MSVSLASDDSICVEIIGFLTVSKSALWGILRCRALRNERNWGSARRLMQSCKNCAKAFCMYAYLALVHINLPRMVPYQECALKRVARSQGLRSDLVMSCLEQISDWPKRPIRQSARYVCIEDWDHKIPCEQCWKYNPCFHDLKDDMQKRLYAMRYGIYPLLEIVGSWSQGTEIA